MPLSVPGKIQKAVFTPGMSYEGRAGFLSAVQIGQRRFNPVRCLGKLAHASFNARKDLESSFHCCGGPVKFVLASLERTRKQFSPLGCTMELAHSPFSARKDLESSFHH